MVIVMNHCFFLPIQRRKNTIHKNRMSIICSGEKHMVIYLHITLIYVNFYHSQKEE